MAQFLAQHKKTPSSPKVSTTLFVINIGTNDIYTSNLTVTAKEVVGTIFFIVDKLRTYGLIISISRLTLQAHKTAGATHFLLTDLVDGARLPAAPDLPAPVIWVFSWYASDFKSQLQANAAKEKIPVVSFYNAFANFQNYPSLYAFKSNLTHSCCFRDPANSTYFGIIPYSTPRFLCKDPADYIFWDLVHVSCAES